MFGAMFATFVVYSALVYTAPPNLPQSLPRTERVEHGQRLYQEYNCVACHQFYGLGGYMGPDLTNVISANGPAYAGAFLRAGSVQMPNFNFDDVQVDALIGYLEFVDASGRFPADQYEVMWNGAVVEARN